ncbi:uncharacterized protein LOC129582018 [Paramacrobiotus metropolitanus]|uniref:uncharacterized protein LOC129582018 n=1 Tax=Paramacrobiotus metropolitanus TaxID=2943436 RepID=UPI0024460D9A|nr:uncharacterized protein LOC129582018 [Paramacrobiotus metropolitanus]
MDKVPHSPLLQGKKLDAFYRCPFVYDGALELSYPPSVYKTDNVFGYQSPNVRISSTGSGHACQSSCQGLHGDTTPAAPIESVEELVARQSRILSKLKELRRQVDVLDASLRSSEPKEETTGPVSSESPVVNAAAPSGAPVALSQKLKDLSGSKSAMQEEILNREVNLLADLKKFREKIDKLSGSSTLSPTKPELSVVTEKILQQPPTSASRDVVVFADPKRPPLWLLPAIKLLTQRDSIVTLTYVHSSVEAVPGLHCFFPDRKQQLSRSDASLIITLIWRNEVASESKNKAEVLRCFLRVIENSNQGATANVDEYLDVLHNLESSDASDHQKAAKTLAARLDKTAFLVGQEPHLLDAVILDGLINADLVKTADGKVKKWIQTCSNNGLFSDMAGFLKC